MSEPLYELPTASDGVLARTNARGRAVAGFIQHQPRRRIHPRRTRRPRPDELVVHYGDRPPWRCNRGGCTSKRWSRPMICENGGTWRTCGDRNETLFYLLPTDHLSQMLPVVYIPKVGLAIERFSANSACPNVCRNLPRHRTTSADDRAADGPRSGRDHRCPDRCGSRPNSGRTQRPHPADPCCDVATEIAAHQTQRQLTVAGNAHSGRECPRCSP
jgi:hypothetical protein